MNILALDPGKEDFAYAFIVRGRFKEGGMLSNPINNITDAVISKQIILFRRDVDALLNKCLEYDVKIIVAERFQVRGRMNGASSEYINFMLGYIAALVPKGILFKVILPATWKNALQALHKVPKKTDTSKIFGFVGVTKTMGTLPITDHIFDALGIGYYYSKCDFDKLKKSIHAHWKSNRPTEKSHIAQYNRVTYG